MRPALHLSWLGIRSIYFKLAYDFAHELTVAICGAIVLGLAAYITQDFLNAEIKQISMMLRDELGIILSILLILIPAQFCARIASQMLMKPGSLYHFALRIGSSQASATGFLVVMVSLAMIFGYGLYWFLTCRYFFKFNFLNGAALQLFGLIASGGFFLLQRKNFQENGPVLRSYSKELINPSLLNSKLPSPWKILLRWQLGQMLKRNLSVRISLVVGSLAVAANIGLLWKGIAFPGVYALMFFSGLFLAFALAVQTKEDISNAWCEKHWGVSHDQFIQSHKLLGLLWCGLFGLIIFCMVFVALMSSHAQPSHGTLQALSMAAKTALAFCSSSLLLPGLTFQIDARRPALSLLMAALLGLILATAIFAHWLGLLAYFAFSYYAEQIQTGRFYRA